MAKRKNKTQKQKMSLKERYNFGDYEIPSCVHTQTVRIYAVAGGILFVGLCLAIISFDLFLAIGILIISLVAAMFGFLRERKISIEGFQILDGVCTKVEYTLGSQAANMLTGGRSKDTPNRFLIDVGDELVAIPYYKQNQLLAEDDNVRIYLRNNVKFIEVRGAMSPDSILGYELIH